MYAYLSNTAERHLTVLLIPATGRGPQLFMEWQALHFSALDGVGVMVEPIRLPKHPVGTEGFVLCSSAVERKLAPFPRQPPGIFISEVKDEYVGHSYFCVAFQCHPDLKISLYESAAIYVNDNL